MQEQMIQLTCVMRSNLAQRGPTVLNLLDCNMMDLIQLHSTQTRIESTAISLQLEDLLNQSRQFVLWLF